jgi:hypothetical protein
MGRGSDEKSIIWLNDIVIYPIKKVAKNNLPTDGI